MEAIAIAQALRAWHDFYALIGEAAATLVGLTFVAASVGGGFSTPRRKVGMQSFLTPTVVHFTAILVTCLIVLAPSGPTNPIALLLVIDGLAGLVYCGWILLRMLRHGFFASIDMADRLWYALLQTVGYLLIGAAGLGLLRLAASSLDILAIGLVVLLIAAIRNAWDMTTWIIQRRGS